MCVCARTSVFCLSCVSASPIRAVPHNGHLHAHMPTHTHTTHTHTPLICHDGEQVVVCVSVDLKHRLPWPVPADGPQEIVLCFAVCATHARVLTAQQRVHVVANLRVCMGRGRRAWRVQRKVWGHAREETELHLQPKKQKKKKQKKKKKEEQQQQQWRQQEQQGATTIDANHPHTPKAPVPPRAPLRV